MRIPAALTVLAAFWAPTMSAEQSADDVSRLRRAFLESMQALRALPDPPPLDEDVRLRERILAIVASLEVPPRVPSEAERRIARGVLAFRAAENRIGYLAAEAEFRRAVVLVPWYAPALRDLALVEERLEWFPAAAANLRFYARAVGDPAEAARSSARAAELDSRAERQRALLGEYTSAGKVSGDVQIAASVYRWACGAGVARGCWDLAQAHYFGHGVPEDLKASARLGERACDAGVPDGCARAGIALAHASGAESEATASLYERGCQAGSPWACAKLGLLYRTGESRPLDESRALQLFETACSGGDSRGCAAAGLMYHERAASGSQDFPRALLYWNRACELGESSACVDAANLLWRGAEGVLQDHSSAVALHDRACSLGHADGCNSAGYMHDMGLGAAKDPLRAADLYERGCDLGSATACYNLGICFALGTGRAVDLGRATGLFAKACEAGHKGACENLNRREH